MHRWIFPFIVGLVSSGPTAYAHHSIAGMYDSARETTLEGVITEFHFVRPHPFLILTTDSGTGERQTWQLEMDNHFELLRIGIEADTFEPGDHVVAVGHPGREQAAILYVRRLDRASDGLRYEQIGSSPRIGARP